MSGFYSSTQPLDADLTALAALTTTSFGRSVLEVVDAAALRTLAGLGTIATQNANAVTITGGTFTGGAGSFSGVTIRAGGLLSLNRSDDGNATRLDCPSGSTFRVRDGGDIEMTWGGSVLDVTGEVRSNTARLDVAPTAETPSMTHTVPYNFNGTAYKIPAVAA